MTSQSRRPSPRVRLCALRVARLAAGGTGARRDRRLLLPRDDIQAFGDQSQCAEYQAILDLEMWLGVDDLSPKSVRGRGWRWG